MAILEVLTFPNSQLRKKCVPVENVTSQLRTLAEELMETMHSYRGIGLAAAQVGKLIRLVVIDCRPKEGGRYTPEEMTELEQKVEQPLVMFNPVILNAEGETTYDEGCLSVPSYFETVNRFETIEVEYLDINGESQKFMTDGLLSVCVQHEIDHLNGKLFIDRLSTIKSNRIKNKIKKFGYPDPNEKNDDGEEL